MHLPAGLLPRPQSEGQLVAPRRFQHDGDRLRARSQLNGWPLNSLASVRLRPRCQLQRCEGIAQSVPAVHGLRECAQARGRYYMSRMSRMSRVPHRTF